jgi:hypothetical protein
MSESFFSDAECGDSCGSDDDGRGGEYAGAEEYSDDDGRRGVFSPARHRTSASAAVSASTAPITNLTGSPGSDNGAPPLEHDDVKVDFIDLYSGSSQACNKKYNKEAKINIFYEALSLEYSILLGDSPPPKLKAVCTSYRENVKKRSKWKLMDIGGAVYELAKYIHDREKQSGRESRNSKIRALVTMYEYFTGEIARKESERQSRMDRARKSSAVSKTVRPPPPNFKYDKTMVCIYHHYSSM